MYRSLKPGAEVLFTVLNDALHMWGGTAGNWGKRPLDLDEIKILNVACKTAEPSDAVNAWR